MKILFITDNIADLSFFVPLLSGRGHQVTTGSFGEPELLTDVQAEAVILDPNFETGLVSGFMSSVGSLSNNPKVIIITPLETDSIPLSDFGELFYLRKPFDMEELFYLLDGGKISALPPEGSVLTDGLFSAASPAMKAVYELTRQVAPTEASVLITGETGTGKEVVANLLHKYSRRSAKEMVAINCAAIPETLLESELFGYEKGAFTGASAPHPGKFEHADGSTIFLDEIGDMTLQLQAKVLRVIQEKKVQRLGSNDSRNADARFLAATNKDLETMMKERQFREDLYYRLNVIRIHLPPLRERREDLIHLSNTFLKHFSNKYDKTAESISPEACKILLSYHWPGNIRELQNLMESVVILSRNRIISPEDIPRQIQPRLATTSETITPSLSEDLRTMEKRAVESALKEANGNKVKAARLLGISRRTLYNKIEKYGIGTSD